MLTSKITQGPIKLIQCFVFWETFWIHCLFERNTSKILPKISPAVGNRALLPSAAYSSRWKSVRTTTKPENIKTNNKSSWVCNVTRKVKSSRPATNEGPPCTRETKHSANHVRLNLCNGCDLLQWDVDEGRRWGWCLFFTSSFSLYSTYFSVYLSQSPSVCPLPINLFNRKDECLRISQFSIHVHIFMLFITFFVVSLQKAVTK